MQRIDLSGLFGTRESAADVIAMSGLPSDLSGQTVAIYCRDLLTGSTSFADQLVRAIVRERRADAIVLVGAPPRFAQHMLDAAERRGVSGKVRQESAAELSV